MIDTDDKMLMAALAIVGRGFRRRQLARENLSMVLRPGVEPPTDDAVTLFDELPGDNLEPRLTVNETTLRARHGWDGPWSAPKMGEAYGRLLELAKRAGHLPTSLLAVRPTQGDYQTWLRENNRDGTPPCPVCGTPVLFYANMHHVGDAIDQIVNPDPNEWRCTNDHLFVSKEERVVDTNGKPPEKP